MHSSAFSPDAELSGVHVLVVEDDAELRELLETLLSTFGVDVTTADGGDEGFERFVERRPDVIISDVQMPGGNGLDLIRRIRALPPAAGGLTPAIALSGVSDRHETTDAGFHVHFKKPASAQALLDAVRAFVRANRLRSPI